MSLRIIALCASLVMMVVVTLQKMLLRVVVVGVETVRRVWRWNAIGKAVVSMIGLVAGGSLLWAGVEGYASAHNLTDEELKEEARAMLGSEIATGVSTIEGIAALAGFLSSILAFAVIDYAVGVVKRWRGEEHDSGVERLERLFRNR